MLDRFCERLAKEWEVPKGFRTNLPHIYAIPLDEDLEIVLTEIEGGFSLSSTLGPLPQENKEETVLELMKGNFLGQQTRGAVLGLDDKDNITLSQVVKHVVQFNDFQEVIEDFISTIDQWRP